MSTNKIKILTLKYIEGYRVTNTKELIYLPKTLGAGPELDEQPTSYVLIAA